MATRSITVNGITIVIELEEGESVKVVRGTSGTRTSESETTAFSPGRMGGPLDAAEKIVGTIKKLLS